VWVRAVRVCRESAAWSDYDVGEGWEKGGRLIY
jgi:hypothetical protein